MLRHRLAKLYQENKPETLLGWLACAVVAGMGATAACTLLSVLLVLGAFFLFASSIMLGMWLGAAAFVGTCLTLCITALLSCIWTSNMAVQLTLAALHKCAPGMHAWAVSWLDAVHPRHLLPTLLEHLQEGHRQILAAATPPSPDTSTTSSMQQHQPQQQLHARARSRTPPNSAAAGGSAIGGAAGGVGTAVGGAGVLEGGTINQGPIVVSSHGASTGDAAAPDRTHQRLQQQAVQPSQAGPHPHAAPHLPYAALPNSPLRTAAAATAATAAAGRGRKGRRGTGGPSKASATSMPHVTESLGLPDPGRRSVMWHENPLTEDEGEEEGGGEEPAVQQEGYQAVQQAVQQAGGDGGRCRDVGAGGSAHTSDGNYPHARHRPHAPSPLSSSSAHQLLLNAAVGVGGTCSVPVRYPAIAHPAPTGCSSGWGGGVEGEGEGVVEVHSRDGLVACVGCGWAAQHQDLIAFMPYLPLPEARKVVRALLHAPPEESSHPLPHTAAHATLISAPVPVTSTLIATPGGTHATLPDTGTAAMPAAPAVTVTTSATVTAAAPAAAAANPPPSAPPPIPPSPHATAIKPPTPATHALSALETAAARLSAPASAPSTPGGAAGGLHGTGEATFPGDVGGVLMPSAAFLLGAGLSPAASDMSVIRGARTSDTSVTQSDAAVSAHAAVQAVQVVQANPGVAPSATGGLAVGGRSAALTPAVQQYSGAPGSTTAVSGSTKLGSTASITTFAPAPPASLPHPPSPDSHLLSQEPSSSNPPSPKQPSSVSSHTSHTSAHSTSLPSHHRIHTLLHGPPAAAAAGARHSHPTSSSAGHTTLSSSVGGISSSVGSAGDTSADTASSTPKKGVRKSLDAGLSPHAHPHHPHASPAGGQRPWH